MEINNSKKNKNEVINKRAAKSYENTRNGYICKGKFEDKHDKDKNIVKLRTRWTSTC